MSPNRLQRVQGRDMSLNKLQGVQGRDMSPDRLQGVHAGQVPQNRLVVLDPGLADSPKGGGIMFPEQAAVGRSWVMMSPNQAAERGVLRHVCPSNRLQGLRPDGVNNMAFYYQERDTFLLFNTRSQVQFLKSD